MGGVSNECVNQVHQYGALAGRGLTGMGELVDGGVGAVISYG